MQSMVVGTSVIELHLPGVRSLKAKRSILRGLITRVHRHFNVSCGEVDLHDVWQSAALGVAVISTSAVHAEDVLENVSAWIEQNRPDLVVVDYSIEIIS
jgi:hypothetical protein